MKALFTVALTKYAPKSQDLTYLLYGGISVALRPTSLISYLPLYMYHLSLTRNYFKLLWSTIQMGLGILISLLVFDFLWFGAFTVTIFNFMKVNIIDNIASAYGTHQFGWYTTQVREILDYKFSFRGCL